MKKLFPFALIAAFGLLTIIPSCKKSDSSSSSASMSASVNGNSWNATVDSAYSFGGLVEIYGAQVSGSTVSTIAISFLSTPTIGTVNISGAGSSSGATGVYSSGSGTGAVSAHGTVTLTAVSPNLVGTFSFTCEDSTKITGGSFNMVKH